MAVGTHRSGLAGARVGFVLAARRGPEPPAARRESFNEMLWRIVRTFVKHVVRAVGVQR